MKSGLTPIAGQLSHLLRTTLPTSDESRGRRVEVLVLGLVLAEIFDLWAREGVRWFHLEAVFAFVAGHFVWC